ncbi:MAG: hypothetical protein DMD91_17370 [Candidatus Rokuibacteriota bacterium]|nr:MAG: hypothetical protein DMD91_17370 [Candidatus Rokubacteria bacterium]
MTTETLGPTLSASIIGATAGPLTQTIDARWLMAYNAALSDAPPRPIAHPLFAVCYEWPVAVTLREQATGLAIAPLSVHASHDLVIHRPPRAGDRLTTTATVADVVPRRSGALVLMRFETVDANGQSVTTTTYGSLYRGVRVTDTTAAHSSPDRRAVVRAAAEGEASLGESALRSGPDGEVQWSETVAVAANTAHVYTECARIWNPIHTDDAVARAAGLAGIILHGTATLALSISRIVSRVLGGDSTLARGVSARFTGMVKLPSTFVVRAAAPTEKGITFDAVDNDGRPILSQGVLST